MKKVLLVDFAYVGLHGGAHSESYLMRIASILSSNGYYVYLCSGNNKRLEENIELSGLQNCEVINLNLRLLDKLIRRSLITVDSWLSYFKKLHYFQFSSLINVMSVQRLLRDLGENIPVFFAHADSMLPAVPTGISRFFLPKRWTGLYVLPSYQSKLHFRYGRLSFNREKNLALPSCQSILVLHPIYQHFFHKRFQDLNCFYLPEMIDTPVSESDNDAIHSEAVDFNLLNQIKKQAQGRTIISILGNITPRKNLSLFLAAITQLDPSKYFFLVLGRLRAKDEAEHQQELDKLEAYRTELKENVFIDINYYIRSEQEFYALIHLSDILYLHYDKHPFSSNVLAKAMTCRKPVIVNKGYLMEKTVNQYHWKVAVEGEPDKIAQAIEQLVDSGYRVEEHSYQAFMADHSPEQFESAILQACTTLY